MLVLVVVGRGVPELSVLERFPLGESLVLRGSELLVELLVELWVTPSNSSAATAHMNGRFAPPRMKRPDLWPLSRAALTFRGIVSNPSATSAAVFHSF